MVWLQQFSAASQKEDVPVSELHNEDYNRNGCRGWGLSIQCTHISRHWITTNLPEKQRELILPPNEWRRTGRNTTFPSLCNKKEIKVIKELQMKGGPKKQPLKILISMWTLPSCWLVQSLAPLRYQNQYEIVDSITATPHSVMQEN